MKQSANDKFLREVLDVIEQQESRLLVWGLTDGRLAKGEISRLIDPILDLAIENGLDSFLDSNEVIAALSRHGLLFETDSYPYPGYRSRMAETVRLLFRLRQLFPKHAGPNGWQRAPTLVADFRFSWRRRRYPDRGILIPSVLKQLASTVEDSNSKLALDALLKDRGESFKGLAGFQVKATERILENLEGSRTAGTLISAGTGSGKTLAFYLPAIARVATLLVNQSARSHWVKILAIYPRTELLRDQFSEIYSEARRLDNFLSSRCNRKIRIGALFGATPHDGAALRRYSPAGWRHGEKGFVCGFMACTVPECEGDLIWLESDLQKNREILTCDFCGHTIGEDELALTRAGMERQPPDILFTTTEMLNQRLSDSGTNHLFGLRPGAVRAPEMVLLDEVHTYGGTHGAQVGYLIRRWRGLVRTPVSFVGLSATLRDGARFFARLTGLHEHQVAELAPLPTEMIAEGAEYLLALRGDPVSRAALLATTIQTAMLISRMLDTPRGEPSGGTYGQRVFAFTDDIDVINRLYFSLLDAEGRNSRGVPNHARHPDGGLAVLRRPLPSEARERFGQNWSAPQILGHTLSERKRIGRTSSQDPGVAKGMDVIVATASLEVGFNDSGVGAVIQHKAPRDSAQFLQRKGRAGRKRSMRPWTMIVLSDYGRDRLAYRNYERLFDPELGIRQLPFSSRYIQRMQGVYVLLDYLASKIISRSPKGSVWRDLSGPSKSDWKPDQKRRALLVEALAEILDKPAAADELKEHLVGALQISRSDALSLLWEYPRPILTTVVPTALRRLATNWRSGSELMGDFQVRNSPLPEFAPNTLFSDLNLPEVQVMIPTARDGDERESHVMPILQALRAFAPGRVSRRFGVKWSGSQHWIAQDKPAVGDQSIVLGDFYNAVELGDWSIQDGGTTKLVPVYRPVEILPVFPPKEIGDTSNAQLNWHTQILAGNSGTTLAQPIGSAWQGLLLIESHSHAEHCPVEIRRFATGSQAEIKIRGGDSFRSSFTFMQDGKPAALGFTMVVDALRFRLTNPSELWSNIDLSGPTARALRTKRYYDTAWIGEVLEMVENPFAREWLAVIYFAALTHDALIRQVSLSVADEALNTGVASITVNEVLETLFQSPKVSDNLSEQEIGTGETQDRLRQEIEGLLGRSDVMASLRRLATLLWKPIDVSWEPWLQERFTATVAAAAYESVQTLCPELDGDGLVVDIGAGPKGSNLSDEDDSSCTEFWISETTPGGSGSIETFHRIFADDPRRFFSLLRAALEPNEYEIIDQQLGELLSDLVGSEPKNDLVNAVKAFRAAENLAKTESELSALRRKMSDNKFVLFHGFLAALTNRILRPGATADSDSFLYNAWKFWLKEEERLGVELDARTVAYGLSQNDDIDRVITASGLSVPQDNLLAWRFNTISGLLWDRGGDSRRAGLGLYSPFSDLPDAERLLVARYLDQGSHRLHLDESNWRECALEKLGEYGSVTIICPSKSKSKLAEALHFLITNPVESDYLSVFARVDAIRRVGESLESDLVIEEMLQ